MDKTEENELNEVPLSNREVLKVLKARTDHHSRTLDMVKYLESVEKGPNKYPLEILRNIKNINTDLVTLAIVSNTSDLSILNPIDRKKIERYFVNRAVQ